MQILGPQSRLTESETLGVEPSNLCFDQPARWSDAQLSLRTAGLDSCCSEWGLWTSSVNLSWELVRNAEDFHPDLQNQNLCIFKTSYSEIMLQLQKSCKNCTASSHVSFIQLSLMLTSCLTRYSGQNWAVNIDWYSTIHCSVLGFHLFFTSVFILFRIQSRIAH